MINTLSTSQQKRMNDMVLCGIPQEIADLATKVLLGLAPEGMGWLIFANIEGDDAPEILLQENKPDRHNEGYIHITILE